MDNENAVVKRAGFCVLCEGLPCHTVPQFPNGGHAGVCTGPEILQRLVQDGTDMGQLGFHERKSIILYVKMSMHGAWGCPACFFLENMGKPCRIMDLINGRA